MVFLPLLMGSGLFFFSRFHRESGTEVAGLSVLGMIASVDSVFISPVTLAYIEIRDIKREVP